MTQLTHELALLACRQCSKHDGESDIDFSTRLYDVYNSCSDNIQVLIERDSQPNEEIQKLLDSYL